MPIRPKLLLQTSLLLTIFALTIPSYSLADDTCDLACKKEQDIINVQNKLNKTREQLNSVQTTISQLAGQLNVTAGQLAEVQNTIDGILKEINTLDTSLKDRYQQLSAKINIRNTLVRNYSKKSALSDLDLWLSNGFSLSAFLDVYNKAFNSEVIKMIGALNTEIKGFEKNKAEAESLRKGLEKTQNQLVSLKNDLANKKSSALTEANKLEEQSTGYEKQLEKLQSEILAMKSSDENGSVGDSEYSSASTPNPPFSGKAFAIFSYGAYTHYNGMSQYGALGRAKAGQKYTDILKFYYKVGTTKTSKKDKDATIAVSGYGNMSYEKYLWGIAEMPSNWNLEAQKAQAVAARTYAYRSSKPICTSQSCQVFNKSKSNNPPALWKQAIKETDGIILNNPTTSQYSSTTGGYINNIGWDEKNKGGWPSAAYEKLAGSPWFYKAWYTKSYNDGSNCGHPHPWLTAEEMADIINAYVVWTKGSAKDKARISSLPKSCWGGNPYSIEDLREKSKNYGAGYSKATSAQSPKRTNGTVTSITFTLDGGKEVTVDGQTFKTVFNTRSPSYLSIKSRLFNIETKN